MSNNKRRFLLRYISVIQKLRICKASFEEIESYLKRQSKVTGEDLSISKRTFQRDINDIRDIFYINIISDSSSYYFISDDDDPKWKTRMLETFDQLDLLYRAKNPSQYIYYENRIPSGTEHFHGILHAIHNRLLISFKYEKYLENSVTFRIVEPYAIKESHHRWYLIAQNSKDKMIKTFGLDRISELKFENEKFEYPKNFNIDEMFIDSYGIITLGGKQNIILSFDVDQKEYLRSQEIHHTQQVLVNDKKEYRISLNMKVTHDLVKEILSYGDAVEVIEPKRLRKELRKKYKMALNYYKT